MGQLLMALFVLSAGQGALGADQPAPWETWQPPAVTLPNPNGFDVYLKAFALKKDIDARQPPPGGAGGPVAAGPPPPRPPASPDQWGEGPANLPLDQRVALYNPVLKLVREALPMDCRIPPPDKGFDELLPYFAQFRAVARLLRMEAHVRLEAGDMTGAANSALDCMEMAQACATHHTWIGYLVCVACESIGTRALDEVILRLDAEGCKSALARMAQIDKRRIPMSEVIDGEERFMRIVFKQVLANPSLLPTGFGMQSPTAPPAMSEAAQKAYLETMRTTSWGAMDPYWASLQVEAARPYRQRRAPPEPTDPFLKLIAPVINNVWFKEAGEQASFRLRQAQIAACWFLQDKGRVPQTLDELVPAYLPAMPADPFGDGPLKSKVTPDALLIYSVGPDGNDDGGAPIKGVVSRDSLGDIVVTVPKV